MKTRTEKIILEKSGDAQVIYVEVPVSEEEETQEAPRQGLVVNGPPSDPNEGVR